MKINDYLFMQQVDLTTHGKDMLKSFLFNVSGLSGLFTLADREAECIKYIKNTVGSKKVLVSTEISYPS
jgi:GMP synthase (glutamine-hydrolysing)